MPEAHPRFAPEQEVRFAVVMYGGVSLAIYINGVAQELFRLVKATAPADPYPRTAGKPAEQRRVYFADAGMGTAGGRPALEYSEQVYRELGQRLGIAGPAPLEHRGDEPPPVRTRFVVDIISGTSAGGINGVFLGKAIANQQDFGVSAELWLKVADIAALLRGKESWGDIPEQGRVQPESLLNGHRLYREACKALTEMRRRQTEIPGDDFRPAYAEQLELAVTATDLAGLPRPVRLGRERRVTEPVHRKVFRFEYGIAETLGEEHSDFRTEHDPMLAFSARATSSFPFAFEPVKLDDVAFMTRDMPKAAVTPWFVGYPDPGAVFFADGGYLDNKPFSYATQALRRRRADVPVSRKLVYIEPDPAPDTTRPPAAGERPDVYRNVMDAMGALPRFEPIRQDIQDVTDRNAAVARLRGIERDAVQAVEADLAGTAPAPGPVRDAYLSLRARTVLDSLGALAARLQRLSEDEDRAIDTRDALGAWAGPRTDRDAQLQRLDAAFEHRRASFLQDRASELLRGGEALPAKAAAAASLPDVRVADPHARALAADDADAVRAFKRALNDAFDLLRRAGRAPYAHALEDTLDESQRTLFAAVDETALLLPDGAGGYVDAVAAFLERPLRAARDGIGGALGALAGTSWTGALLSAYDTGFELFDGIVLPLAYPDLGEANAVELWRVSPRDSVGAVPAEVNDPPEKLAGLRLHHFGAFLDESYRENDLLWGRLDGAEAIMRAVLPDHADEALREQYRVAAQAAILRDAMPERLRALLADELALPPSEANDAALLDAFLARYTPPGHLDAGRREQLAGQALAITGQVLAKDARKHRIPKLPLALLGRTGPAIVRLARVRAGLKRLNPFR